MSEESSTFSCEQNIPKESNSLPISHSAEMSPKESQSKTEVKSNDIKYCNEAPEVNTNCSNHNPVDETIKHDVVEDLRSQLKLPKCAATKVRPKGGQTN